MYRTGAASNFSQTSGIKALDISYKQSTARIPKSQQKMVINQQ